MNYGTDGQLGLERTPQEYIAKMVAVFEEVRRVLKPTENLHLLVYVYTNDGVLVFGSASWDASSRATGPR